MMTEEFKKKIIKTRLPDLFKNDKLSYVEAKNNRLVTFPPRKTKLGALVAGIVYKDDNTWEVRNIKKTTVLLSGKGTSLLDAKRKIRYAMKQLGVKFNVITKTKRSST